MRIRQTILVFDAADILAEATFWAGVFGGTTEAEPDWVTVRDADGLPRIGVQLAPNHIRPQWPDGQPQQLHLDVYVATREEAAEADEEVLRMGATLLQPATDPDAEGGFTVFADPAGHPFCICWG